jgi:hypothetical protein
MFNGTEAGFAVLVPWIDQSNAGRTSMAARPKNVAKDEDAKNVGWTRRVMPPDEILVRQGMAAYEAERHGLVDGLKSAVWSGAYSPDPEEVAEALMAEREAQWLVTRQEEDASESPKG